MINCRCTGRGSAISTQRRAASVDMHDGLPAWNRAGQPRPRVTEVGPEDVSQSDHIAVKRSRCSEIARLDCDVKQTVDYHDSGSLIILATARPAMTVTISARYSAPA